MSADHIFDMAREIALLDKCRTLEAALKMEIAMAEAPGAAYPASVASSI